MIHCDAAVVGSGPNGLAASVTLARAGLRVELYERADDIGGGLRSASLFDRDVVHDVCSAVHPMALVSPFFKEFDLASRGVEFLHADISYGHPLGPGTAALAYRDLDQTCDRLGDDGPRWRRLMRPLLERSRGITDFALSGQRSLPSHPVSPALLALGMLRHGTAWHGLRTKEAAALATGVAAHAIGYLPSLTAGGITVLLGHLAHGTGWPLPRGGSVQIAQALADDLVAHGGRIHTGAPVEDLRQLCGARAVLLDVSPKGLLALADWSLPSPYARALAAFRYGPGAAKADFLVSEPVPWRNPELSHAGTVHLGGTRAEILRQETLTARGVPTDKPFVLLCQPTAADPGRARPGKLPVWAYAHVPNGDTRNPLPLIRAAIERYAPGFGDTVIAERGIPAAALESYNPNYVGGDIGSGAMTLRQTLLRPVPRLDPYRTPLPGVYLCSASTPPGPGVHGMSGYLAARSALRREFGIRHMPDLGPGHAAQDRTYLA
ncbi:phytoene desaturase family protein [Streptomyces sporangiiformans]|uniref:NAD(P)/FAD-dependent oxidoreductase n=1 Tax=Streptomyces sporangiiformans TaxID=2315329 RepID=A0A505DD68_9ACTN|nr:NAD(P)/FAD-dependent oxidoreductase [Streptomyces sporangiiformans]TPQ20777.1 NAD(P)/FAD-dependent oxidoreductase [Streptomyces sporangiiformans]